MPIAKKYKLGAKGRVAVVSDRDNSKDNPALPIIMRLFKEFVASKEKK